MGRRARRSCSSSCSSSVGVAPAAARGRAAHASWIRPVDGAVVRAFDPPRSRFGAGHLGVDLAAQRGTPVRAAGPGSRRRSPGRVAGALHVVVAHAGDLRTSYSFLASISVRRGQVGRGRRRRRHDRRRGRRARRLGAALRAAHRRRLRRSDGACSGRSTSRPIVHLAPTTDPPRPVARVERAPRAARRPRARRPARSSRGGASTARAAAADAAAAPCSSRDESARSPRSSGTARLVRAATALRSARAAGQRRGRLRAPGDVVAGIESSLTGGPVRRSRCRRRSSATSPARSRTSRTRDGGDYTAGRHRRADHASRRAGSPTNCVRCSAREPGARSI